MTILSIFFLGILSFLFYQTYFHGSQAQTKFAATKRQKVITQPTSNKYIAVSPAPVQYRITHGSLYSLPPHGKEILLVDKNSLQGNGLTVIAIESFQLSPDHSKFLLLTDGGISQRLLFTYAIAKKTTSFINFGENPLWSPDSIYVAYSYIVHGDVGTQTVEVFNTITNQDFRLQG